MKNFLFRTFLLGIVVSFSSCGYNKGIELSEKVEASWGQVENVYQRRADLIPNLVNTVKGGVSSEKDILTSVMNARAKATSVNVNAANLTPDKIAQFQQAQDGLSSALSKLMVVVERYPDLKSIQGFSELQAQLEGTENRIAVERRNFNEAVQEYNTFGRSFPNNLFAGMWGYEKKGYFKSAAGADKAPQVNF